MLNIIRSGTLIALLLPALVVTGSAQTNSAAPAQAQSAVIRVTSPQQHQRQTANYVTVQYQLQNPTSAVAASPNFKIQLDGNDPITTGTTEQSFTGLTPGQHVVTVQLVDANGTVVPESQTQVVFVVLPTPQNGATQNAAPSAGGGQPATPAPQARVNNPAANSLPGVETSLPEAGSFLPILSIIGFGVLFGGMVSALKTRS